MLMITILKPDYQFRRLINATDFDRLDPLINGVELEKLDVAFHERSFAEEMEIQEELVADEDNETLDSISERFARGYGDCVAAEGFVASLVFSSRTVERIGESLRSSGQLFPAYVRHELYFVFNCTRIIDAATSRSQVRSLSDGCPSRFTYLDIDEALVAGEYLFKIAWPKHALSANLDLSTIRPPISIFATQQFVELVEDNELTGFKFVAP